MHAVRNVSRVLSVTDDEGEHEAAPNATSGSGVVRDRPGITPIIGIVRLAVRTTCPQRRRVPDHESQAVPSSREPAAGVTHVA
jgi:hypothetical protein